MASLSVDEVAVRLGAFKKGKSLFVCKRDVPGAGANFIAHVVDVKVDACGLAELVIEELPDPELEQKSKTKEIDDDE